MIKKEYQKPEMRVVMIQHRAQILIGSETSITTTGLDDMEILILPGTGVPSTGNLWNDAI